MAIITNLGTGKMSVTDSLQNVAWSSTSDGSPIRSGEHFLEISEGSNSSNTDSFGSLAQDYPVCMREQLGERLPKFTDAEFDLLREADMDFYGMNYYTSQFARHRDSPAPEIDFLGNVDEFQENKQEVSVGEPSGVHWLRSTPGLFRKHLTRVYRKYGKPIYITENGCPCPGEDRMTREEAVQDEYRIRYFQDHIDAVGLACNEDGSDIKGYFAWSLMDNLGKSDIKTFTKFGN
jgi:beta-glucosidase